MIDDYSDRLEETTCQAAQKAPEMLRGAQSVMASSVSFGTISGERPFVPKSASIASEPGEKMIAAGCLGSRSRWIRGQRIGRACHELALQALPSWWRTLVPPVGHAGSRDDDANSK
jgi:hypothetical protein